MPEQITLNPYNLADSDVPIQVRITCDYVLPGEIYPHKWDGVVLLPAGGGRNWESTAVDAYLHARKLGGLQAPNISLCHFSHYDAATKECVEFL